MLLPRKTYWGLENELRYNWGVGSEQRGFGGFDYNGHVIFK